MLASGSKVNDKEKESTYGMTRAYMRGNIINIIKSFWKDD